MDRFLHDLDWVLPLRSSPVTLIMEAASGLGYTAFFLPVLSILYWGWDREKVHRIAIATLSSGLLTFFLKDLFADPRPSAEYWITTHSPTSYGLPSGHTLMAIVFWFSLAAELKNRAFYLLAGFIVTLIALSRLYLGVHDIEDILGGLVAGTILLLLLRFSFGKQPIPLLRSPLVIGIAFATLLGLVFWPGEAAPKRAHLVFAFFLGWALGFSRNQARSETDTQSKKQIALRGLFGVLFVALSAALLQAFLPLLSLPAPWNLVIAGFLIGVAITWLAPLISAKVFRLPLSPRS